MKIRSLSVSIVAAFLLVANPVNATLIGTSNGGLYDLDVATNTATFIGNTERVMFDSALDPITNILYGIAGGNTLVSIDTSTAATTTIGTSAAFVNGLTFDSAGTLYGTGGTGLYTINLLNGLASLVGNTGYTSSGDIAFDSGGNLFMSATGGDRLVSLNVGTGAGTLIGNIGFGTVYGLNFSGSTLYGFTLSGATITIDTGSGLGTFFATNGLRANGADGVGGVSVPEPGTLALLGIGLLGMGISRRRKEI